MQTTYIAFCYWEQLSVKRQGGSFVLVLNQEAMQKIQTIEKQDTSNKQTQQQQQKGNRRRCTQNGIG